MGFSDLFRKKTKAEKDWGWSRESVKKWRKMILQLMPILTKNYEVLKGIYDRAKEEGWKRNAWEKKNVRKKPGFYIGSYYCGEIQTIKGIYPSFEDNKQNEIDEAFIYRCENKHMMFFLKYASESGIDLKEFNYKNYKDYFENKEEFFNVIEDVTGSVFTNELKKKFYYK